MRNCVFWLLSALVTDNVSLLLARLACGSESVCEPALCSSFPPISVPSQHLTQTFECPLAYTAPCTETKRLHIACICWHSTPQQHLIQRAAVQGDIVVIPNGWNLVINEPLPALAELWIEGNVTVSDESSIVITAGFIIVRNGGSLTAGTKDVPRTRDLYIMLTGTRESPIKSWTEDIVMGSKCLAVVNGTLHAADPCLCYGF